MPVRMVMSLCQLPVVMEWCAVYSCRSVSRSQQGSKMSREAASVARLAPKSPWLSPSTRPHNPSVEFDGRSAPRLEQNCRPSHDDSWRAVLRSCPIEMTAPGTVEVGVAFN